MEKVINGHAIVRYTLISSFKGVNMYCVLCQKKIDETKGYFTILIRGNRYDYHLPCRPANIPI